MSNITINGKFVSEKNAKISIKDRGFRLGDGMFETISFYNKSPFLLPIHLRRIADGLKLLKIKLSQKEISAQITNIISKQKYPDGILRLTITRGQGSRGYLPHGKQYPTIVIEAMPRPMKLFAKQNIKLCISPMRRIPFQCLPQGVKNLSSLNYILSKMHAAENGFDDALQLTITNHIAETSSANIFWFVGNVLHTPSLDCNIVNGVIRQHIIQNLLKSLAKQNDKSSQKTSKQNLKIKEGLFTIASLAKADSVFITNVTHGIAEVSEIKGENKKPIYKKKSKSPCPNIQVLKQLFKI